MGTWNVTLPISGVIYTTVKADSEKEAIDKALEGEYTYEDIETWETHKHIVQGNVCYAVQWSAEAEEEPDEEAPAAE